MQCFHRTGGSHINSGSICSVFTGHTSSIYSGRRCNVFTGQGEFQINPESRYSMCVGFVGSHILVLVADAVFFFIIYSRKVQVKYIADTRLQERSQEKHMVI